MGFSRIKVIFIRLPTRLKLIGLGALILAVSTLMPWYADLDAYKIGDQFLGITGPASFVGIVILLLSAFSLWMFSYHLLERKAPRLPVREGIINIFVAIESLFLLVLVNSIFFHPKFGVNITLKESRFGMTLAFIGTIILLAGAYLQNREEMEKERGTGKLEPLIKIEPQPAQVQEVSASSKQPVQERSRSPIVPRKVIPQMQLKEMPRSFLFGEKGAFSAAARTVMHEKQPLDTVGASSAAEPQKSAAKDNKTEGTYMLRMDL